MQLSNLITIMRNSHTVSQAYEALMHLRASCLLLSLVQCVPRTQWEPLDWEEAFGNLTIFIEKVQRGLNGTDRENFSASQKVAEVALLIADHGERAVRDQDDTDSTWKNLSEDEKQQLWHVAPMKSLPPHVEGFFSALSALKDAPYPL